MKILRLNHLNHLTTDREATQAHYENVLGAQYLMDIGGNPFTAGFLTDVGGEIVEVLIPKVLDKAEGKQLTRFGPHYSSLEIWVPDLAEAREQVVGRGIRLLIDGAHDFLTLGADTEGVIFQVYDQDWHRDPPPEHYQNHKRPAEWWRDEHPIGYLGMRHLTFATDDPRPGLGVLARPVRRRRDVSRAPSRGRGAGRRPRPRRHGRRAHRPGR